MLRPPVSSTTDPTREREFRAPLLDKEWRKSKTTEVHTQPNTVVDRFTRGVSVTEKEKRHSKRIDTKNIIQGYKSWEDLLGPIRVEFYKLK